MAVLINMCVDPGMLAPKRGNYFGNTTMRIMTSLLWTGEFAEKWHYMHLDLPAKIPMHLDLLESSIMRLYKSKPPPICPYNTRHSLPWAVLQWRRFAFSPTSSWPPSVSLRQGPLRRSHQQTRFVGTLWFCQPHPRRRIGQLDRIPKRIVAGSMPHRLQEVKRDEETDGMEGIANGIVRHTYKRGYFWSVSLFSVSSITGRPTKQRQPVCVDRDNMLFI